MRRFLIIMFLPILLIFLYACGSGSDAEDVRAEEIEERDFSASNIQHIIVDTENGNIQSSIWTDTSIHIVLEKWATGDGEAEAIRNIDDIELSITEDTAISSLSINVDIPDNMTTDYGCNVSINMPATIELDLESANGNIKIEDTEAKAKLRTTNGEIDANNHQGDLDGETSNGAINVDITLPEDGKCELKTSNGNITLSVDLGTSAEIEASTLNGKIEIDNPDVVIDSEENGKIEAEIGDGDGDIDLETLNGNIYIR